MNGWILFAIVCVLVALSYCTEVWRWIPHKHRYYYTSDGDIFQCSRCGIYANPPFMHERRKEEP